jgi:hypothetical protein
MEEAVVVTGVVAASAVVTAEVFMAVAWVASTAAAWAVEVSMAEFAEAERVSRAADFEAEGSAGASVVTEAMVTAVTAMMGTDSPEVFLPVH